MVLVWRKSYLQGKVMLNAALQNPNLSAADRVAVKAHAQRRGLSAALGLLGGLVSSAAEQMRRQQERAEQLATAYRADSERIRAGADEIADEKRPDYHAPQPPKPARPTSNLQAGQTEPLDSATRSYMAWAKAVKEGRFNTAAYARFVEQENLSKIACVQPVTQVFLGPAPMPTPTLPPTPPAISGKDVAKGLCEAADAVDPIMPNPETIGGPGIGDIIDQAHVAQQNIPYASTNPLFESLIRVPIVAAKVFKDGPSTVVNFVCQQKDKEGPYYEWFPIDQKIQAVKNNWNQMDTRQKVFVVGFTVLALLIAMPLLVR